jgi:acetyl-CoA acetyltransferase
LEYPGQLGAVVNAALAVSAGLCKHVRVWRSVYDGSAQGSGGRAAVMPGGGDTGTSFKASGFMEWLLPFSAPSAATWIAMYATRHFHEYGTTREQLGQIAVNARKNAALNPKAIYTDPILLGASMPPSPHPRSSRTAPGPSCAPAPENPGGTLIGPG